MKGEPKARLDAFAHGLNQNPLHFIERDLVVAAVIGARGPGALMVRHLLRHFGLAAVPQILRYAVARKVWQLIFVWMPASTARRPIMR